MQKMRDSLELMRNQYEGVHAPAELKERLNIMMSDQKNTRKQSNHGIIWLQRVGGGVIAAALMLTVATNASARAAEVLGNIPVIGAFTKIVTFRDYSKQDGNTEAHIKTPHITGIGDKKLEDELNAAFDAYADQLIGQYEADVAALGDKGHESVDSRYEVLTDNEQILTIAIHTTIARGGAQQLETYYTIDKATGRLLKLSDLFQEGADYVAAITADIRDQMARQMKEDDSKMYFLKSDEEPEGFDTIKPDQQFFLTPEGKLVISFNEYDVAPGYMGAVQFTISDSAIKDILSDGGRVK